MMCLYTNRLKRIFKRSLILFMWLWILLLHVQMCGDISHSVEASFIFFSLSSFQSSKKIWTYTWVCSSLLSPLAQVCNLAFIFQNFSFFSCVLPHLVTLIQCSKMLGWRVMMFFFQVGGLISLQRMTAVDFTVLSGTLAPYCKLSDAWLSISSGKSLLHVSVMPWQWWRGQWPYTPSKH